MSSGDSDERKVLMRAIRDEVWNGHHLPLYQERIRHKVFPVIGEGSHCARLMFIGEAPGRTEAMTGKPFCGAAGKVLDELLAFIAVPRESVYVTNIVKDRPPFNRDPLPEEITAYAPFLDRQVMIIQPRVIATLGRYSMGYVMTKFGLEAELDSISKIHGRIFKAQTGYGEISIVPLFHPAVAVYDVSKKEVLKNDFNVVKNFASI